MKILMLGWELPPYNSGGLGVACYQLCKALASKGADIEFVLPYQGEHEIDFMRVNAAQAKSIEELRAAGNAYESFRYTSRWHSTDGVFATGGDIVAQTASYEQAIGRVVELADFDIIHAHDWLTFRAALRAKEKTNRPLILHVHSIESDRAGGAHGNPLVREIERTAMLVADRTIAVSEHTKKAILREYDIPTDKVEVVHNSIEHDSLAPLDATNSYQYLMQLKSQGYRVVTNVGRLTIQKGLTQLLRAARLVVEREPKTVFLLVGSGDQQYELQEMAGGLGISKNVIFTGFQRGKKWRDAYAVSDLFVMPSVSEPFGLVALEAIGYGTPVMISKQSGVSEVLPNCLKVDFWDAEEMANQITAVVRSPALEQALYQGSLGDYQRLSWGKTADRLLDLYRRHLKAVTT